MKMKRDWMVNVRKRVQRAQSPKDLVDGLGWLDQWMW